MEREKIIVVDFGSQYTHLIARRIRELKVYSEIKHPEDFENMDLKEDVKGIILSGGPRSVYEKEAPRISGRFIAKVIEKGIPILGICYGHQLIAHLLNGIVKKEDKGEYGISELTLIRNDVIFDGTPERQRVWMSHKDQVVKLPKKFITLASTSYSKIAAYRSNDYLIYGLQFHPEVKHTRYGKKILRNFIYKICKCKRKWKLSEIIKLKIKEIRDRVGNEKVIMAVSGGVDSVTAAYIIKLAINDRLHIIHVNTGLMREGESEKVVEFLRKMKFKNIHYVDAGNLFLKRLRHVKDPEEKRRIIARTFIEVFEEKARELEEQIGEIKFLGQGTIYPDRIESGRASRLADRIKSHHNVVLPEGMKLQLIEPIADFYKDEVRRLALKLGLPKELIVRHPFPGPGLAIRIVGEVTEEKLRIIRKASMIVEEEMERSGLYKKVWQAFPVLLPIKTVGVMGDQRTYQYLIALRIVKSEDGMTADFVKMPWKILERISARIVNEVDGVNRVVYDITNKPPATIEYE